MKRLNILPVATVALLCLAVALLPGDAIGQTKITKDQLVGTWSYASVVGERPDGSKFQPWGPNPVGSLIFTANDRYSVQIIRHDLPKIASKDRLKGTPEENEAVAKGVFSHFGTYTVNEAEGTFTFQVEASSFAADNGTKHVRTITSFSADEFKTTNPTPRTGAKIYTVFKRVK